MADGDVQRLRGRAAAEGLSLHVEGAHADAEAADRDVLRQLEALGARMDRPLLVEVDLVLADPSSAPGLLHDLREQGFHATARAGAVQVDVLTFGTLRTVRSLLDFLGDIAAGHGGWDAGWRARPPIAPADPEAAARDGERRWDEGDLVGARDVLVPVLAGDDPMACPGAAAALVGLLTLLGDQRGADLLSGWMQRGGADAWGAQGATVYALALQDLHAEVDHDVVALLRPPLERAVQVDPDGWGVLAEVELAAMLVHVGDTATARLMLERAVRSGRPSVVERGRQILAEIGG
jgi:hypothetical protein